MIAELKPYPAMKDSGVPWLREVPGHWKVSRLKSRAANVVDLTGELNRDDCQLNRSMQHKR